MSFRKIWNSKERGGRARAKTDQLHTTEQLLIMAPFLSWTKWGLFELLWSLETASRICTHASLLCSYCSRFLQFSGWNTACLYIDQQAIRISSIKLVRFLLIFMAWSGNSRHCVWDYSWKDWPRSINWNVHLLKFKMILHRDEAEFLGSKKKKKKTHLQPTIPFNYAQYHQHTPHMPALTHKPALYLPFLTHPHRKSTPRPLKNRIGHEGQPWRGPGDHRQAVGEEWSPLSRCCGLQQRPVHRGLAGWLQATQLDW